MQLPRGGDKRAGQWLANLLAFSWMETPLLGSTTAAVCAVMASKLTAATVGDTKVSVYRYNGTMKKYLNVFETINQVVVRRDVHGVERPMPKQITAYTPEQKNVANIKQLLGEINTAVFTLEVHDVVIVASDGVWDNISHSSICAILMKVWEQRLSPFCAAQRIVYEAIDANVKPDDVGCYVAFVRR